MIDGSAGQPQQEINRVVLPTRIWRANTPRPCENLRRSRGKLPARLTEEVWHGLWNTTQDKSKAGVRQHHRLWPRRSLQQQSWLRCNGGGVGLPNSVFERGINKKNSEFGLMHITGNRDGPPVKVGVAITDLTTGLYTSNSVMAALLGRAKTNKGQHIDVALSDVQTASLTNIASSVLVTGKKDTGRWGTAHRKSHRTLGQTIC